MDWAKAEEASRQIRRVMIDFFMTISTVTSSLTTGS
jgi:hypothetical protein